MGELITGTLSFLLLLVASKCVGDGGEILGEHYDASIVGGLVIAWLNTAPETIFFITALEGNNPSFAVGAMAGSVIVVSTVALGACIILGSLARRTRSVSVQRPVAKQAWILLMTTAVTMLIPMIGDYSLTAGVIGVLGYIGFVAHSLRSREEEPDAVAKKDEAVAHHDAGADSDVSEEEGDPEPVAKGAMYLALGGGLIFLYADDFIDSVAGIARAWGVSSTLLAFFLAPIASEAPEILEAVMLSRKGYTQTINIALSNLVGGTISKTTLLFGIFNFYGVYKQFAWESPNYAVSIVLLSACAALSACTVAMQREVPLWRGYLLWAAFAATGIIQYIVTTKYIES